ncbi:MAG: ParB N-terminal domain-containing protein [Cetobacterium sp.]
MSEITPDIKNAKEHPQKQIDQIKGSIKEFGFNDPIAVDENNVIIGGHGRSNN